MKPVLRFWSFSVFFLLFSSAFPQTNSYESDTVTITSLRLPARLDETGRNITVVEARQIRELPVRSFDDLLRYLPGVEVQQRGPLGSQGDIIIRGSTFSQVLVLIDGMRFNDPLTGHFNSYVPVPLSEIARVEVLRGPAAAMYGPDAVGGVINIITRTFAGSKTEKGTRSFSDLAYGSHQLIRAEQSLYHQTEKLRLGAGLLLGQTEGQALAGGSRSDIDMRSLSTSLGYQLGKAWRLAGRAAFDQRTFNAQYFYTRSSLDESREQVRNAWGQLQLHRTGEKSHTELNLVYKSSRDSFLFNPAFPANLHTTRFYLAQLNHSLQLGKGNSLLLGGQADLRAIRSSDRGDHEDGHAALYAMGLLRPLPGLALTLGLRADWDQNYGFELLPQLNASYRLQRFVFRASSGRSIRAADYTERFISNNLPGPLPEGRNLGNPALEAERAWSHEAGLDWYPLEALRLRATGFLRQGRNLIDYLLTPAEQIPNNDNLQAGATYFFTQNQARISSKGLEVEARLRKELGKGWQLEALLAYTHLRTQGAGGDSLVSKYLANHARHLLTGRLQVGNAHAQLSLTGLWKERNAEAASAINAELAPRYGLLNARCLFRLAGGKLRPYLQVDNLSNTRFSDILGAEMPGRWWSGGLQVQLF